MHSLDGNDWFAPRHIGPSLDERDAMLKAIGARSLDALIDEAIPASIRLKQPLNLPPAESEHQYLRRLALVSRRNKTFRSYIGLGYHDTVTPSVILRMVMENPGWYTPYTPYQAEIAQGRLESLLNFQTMVADLTGMEVANASLLDEATAAAEAMTLLHRVHPPSPKATAVRRSFSEGGSSQSGGGDGPPRRARARVVPGQRSLSAADDRRGPRPRGTARHRRRGRSYRGHDVRRRLPPPAIRRAAAVSG